MNSIFFFLFNLEIGKIQNNFHRFQLLHDDPHENTFGNFFRWDTSVYSCKCLTCQIMPTEFIKNYFVK